MNTAPFSLYGSANLGTSISTTKQRLSKRSCRKGQLLFDVQHTLKPHIF
ncbi:hypothetical protein PAECIP111802_05211 [Paenibacillus allorhizosphaerae]|uniref:Uncharacterized protein n=1 Tax=Paenibacillus allorhizosphaerae TaxID=2849866 RepID=A0ABM8VP35_9BACL|nr:hypothetical protein PAECIP111802_05211 [Paenibacillus allorhizosphaerae]